MARIKMKTVRELNENDLKKTQIFKPNNSPFLSSYYDFNSDNLIYTVQIGAFQEKAETSKFIELSSLFNHLYNDGLDRYYSGVFEFRLDAINYMNQLKKNGYHDVFIVGLKGEKRI